jgi:membrane-bound lytic murein transglycosylase A
VDRTRLRSRLIGFLLLANVLAVGVVAWITLNNEPAEPRIFRVTPIGFVDLPGWGVNDPESALAALQRSCAVLEKRPPDQAMGGAGYAGRVGAWLPACEAIGAATSSVLARAYFEKWFAPLAIDGGAFGLITGYYEPELAGSWNRTQRFHVPIYGPPDDLVRADLGQFHSALAGEHISGRLAGSELEPYPTRAEIDASGLAHAPIILYTDDPVSAFFLHIQGSGRVRFADGETLRLAFAATNGRPYTSIGRVLIAKGAIEREQLSMQSIRAWLLAHPSEAQSVMEEDRSFVFFTIAPLGDPSLGSPGSEGVALAPLASLAVDTRFHALGTPIYAVATIPDANAAKPDRAFGSLLIAQDTGGAIKGSVRGDVFFGPGKSAEAIAGRMKSHGRIFALVPKPVAEGLKPFKEYRDSAQ